VRRPKRLDAPDHQAAVSDASRATKSGRVHDQTDFIVRESRNATTEKTLSDPGAIAPPSTKKAAPGQHSAQEEPSLQVEANERVQEIRSRAQHERVLISELDGKLADLKPLLKPASNLLDDVEGFFLDAKIMQEPRSGDALARWLGHAEMVLQRAVQHREYVEGLVKKFGTNARIIG
jgi:hypothetical protein